MDCSNCIFVQNFITIRERMCRSHGTYFAIRIDISNNYHMVNSKRVGSFSGYLSKNRILYITLNKTTCHIHCYHQIDTLTNYMNRLDFGCILLRILCNNVKRGHFDILERDVSNSIFLFSFCLSHDHVNPNVMNIKFNYVLYA